MRAKTSSVLGAASNPRLYETTTTTTTTKALATPAAANESKQSPGNNKCLGPPLTY